MGLNKFPVGEKFEFGNGVGDIGKCWRFVGLENVFGRKGFPRRAFGLSKPLVSSAVITPRFCCWVRPRLANIGWLASMVRAPGTQKNE